MRFDTYATLQMTADVHAGSFREQNCSVTKIASAIVLLARHCCYIFCRAYCQS